MIPTFFRRWPLLAGLCLTALASAGVVRVETTDQSEVLASASFGSAGPYVRITGKVHFAVDPKLPVNRVISDIDYAPRSANGLVEFSADLYLLRPKDPARSNGTVLFEVSNRGRKSIVSLFNNGRGSFDPRTSEEFGDRFLLERGYTLAWIGWQFDVPPEPNLLQFRAPAARDGDKPITGLVRSDFVPDERVTEMHVADRTHIPYPVAHPDDPGLQLTVRERRDGPRVAIPRSQWRLNERRTHVLMPSGFEPGKIYELVYMAQDPVLVGLGPAAIRDFIAHLKANAETTGVRRAIAFGSSQSGRFLRTFLYFGFNQAEQGGRVFDAVWSHIAGAGRGSFNHRFAQPSRDARPFFNFFYPTDLFPFTHQPQADPITGLKEGLLDRTVKAGVVPRIFYTNGSYEYYGRAASLIHTTVDGHFDLAPDANTRIYFIAGSQHGPAAGFPPARQGTQNLASSNDYRWAMRALLVALHGWISDGVEPPASQFPYRRTRQLVALPAVQFPAIPGVRFPERIHYAADLDFGPDFRSKGIISTEPPVAGRAYPVLLPQVDADGNETSGIRMPWIQAPLATYTGWNLRDPKIGAPDEMFSFAGSTLPFARTRAERLKAGDSRLSIEERYKSREEYLVKVRAVARSLAAGRYLLESDLNAILAAAGEKWDHWAGSREAASGR
jgi:hypothetical protein